MGVFQKIGNALARLMYGRNGVDQLSLAIVVGSLVLDLVSMFVAHPSSVAGGMLLYLVSIAAWAFALFRIFSRNLYQAPGAKTSRWVNWMWRMKSSRSRMPRPAMRTRPTNTSPARTVKPSAGCRWARGKIVITCPKCGAQIHART